MFKHIRKAWRGLQFFIRARKVWGSPRHSDVLIYDATRQNTLMEFFGPWQPEVIHLRAEEINVWIALHSLFRRGERFGNYVDCYIEKVQPRLVVTFNDLSYYFYTISKKYPAIKTLFIQNGLRTSNLYFVRELDISIRSKFFVDYMLVFGECVGNEYKRLIGGEAITMGSIVNNTVPKECRSQPGVLAFVSQWEPTEFYIGFPKDTFYSHEVIYEKPDRITLESLVSYAEKKNKRFMIIPRFRKGSDCRMTEKGYYRDLLGSEPEYLELENPNSSYHAVDTAEVTVSLDSTMGVESLARGNKTAIFSIRTVFADLPAGNFGWPGDFPDEGLFWTNKPDPDSFNRVLDYLFEVDELQWLEDLRAFNFPFITKYDLGNTVLKSTLKRVLGAAPLASKD